MRIVLAQLQHEGFTDLKHRVEATAAAIQDAASAGAELVVLPELAGSGYVLDAAHLERSAEPGDASGPVVGSWREACVNHGIAVVGGYAELDGHRMFNSAIAIDRSGRVAGRYRKLHLFGVERELFDPGDCGLPVVELSGLRVGMLICYDLRFPEAARILALQGADLIAVPTAWIDGFDRPDPRLEREIGQIEATLVHANLNQVFIACADFVGTSADLTFLGRSLVVDPFGDVVEGPLAPDAPGVIVTDLDPTMVVAASERGPGISPRLNRRTDVYGGLLGYQPANQKELT